MWWIYAIFSAIAQSMSDIYRKKALTTERGIDFVLPWTMIALLLSMLLLPFVRFDLTPLVYMKIFIASILLTISIVLIAKAYRHLQISTVAPLLNFSPVFLVIIARVFLGEKLTYLQLSGIGIILLGSYLLEVNHTAHTPLAILRNMIKSKYYIFVGVVVVSYSIVATVQKSVLLEVNSPITLLFFFWFFVAININIVHLIRGDWFEVMKFSFTENAKPVVLGGIFLFITNILYLQALSLAFASLVVPIKRLSTLITTAIGGELFHEHRLLQKAGACFVMMIGSLLVMI